MNNEKCRVEDRFVSHERVDELRGGATLVSASPFVQTKSHEHMLRVVSHVDGDLSQH